MGKKAVTFWTAATLLSLKKAMQRGWQERLCDRTVRARGGIGLLYEGFYGLSRRKKGAQ